MNQAGPIRILHVMPSWGVGGVQVRIVDIASRLGEGFSHRALGLDGCYDALARTPAGVDFASAELPGPPPRGLRASLHALSALRGRMPLDLLCTYNWGAMDWALAARLQRHAPAHLHFESGFGPEEAARPLLRRSLVRRLALARARALVVPSMTLRRLACAHRWARAERIRLIPNGVDTAFYAPPPRRRTTADAPLRIVSVAPLRREKRLDLLLRMVAVLSAERTCRLSLVGDGPMRGQLEELAADLGIAKRVRFTGTLDDVRPALQGADIFAMTSETEQMPNALLQAMASALPVVAFAAGDVARILPPEQSAFVRPQGDERGFVAALRALADAPERRRALGDANRRHACATYPMTRMVEAYRRLYEEAVGR